jgi:hypothetical protein
MSTEDRKPGGEIPHGTSSTKYDELLHVAQQDGSDERSGSRRAVAELMQDPSIRTGVAEVDAVVQRHYEQLKEAGREVTEVVHGYTPDGRVIRVGSYPSEEESAQRKQYSVFMYRLNEVGQPDFAAKVVPLAQAEVIPNRAGSVNIVVVDPEAQDSLPAPPEVIAKLLADELDDRNLAAAYNDWRARNNNVLNVPLFPGRLPRYGDQDVLPWPNPSQADVQDRITAETAPLRERAAHELTEADRAAERVRLMTGVTVDKVRGENLKGRPKMNYDRAVAGSKNAEELRRRADKVEEIMAANPAMVVNPEHPVQDIVHDPIKAEQMAREMAPAMDNVVKGKQVERNTTEAGARVTAAAQAYEADPLSVAKTQTRPKGLLGRLFGR